MARPVPLLTKLSVVVLNSGGPKAEVEQVGISHVFVADAGDW